MSDHQSGRQPWLQPKRKRIDILLARVPSSTVVTVWAYSKLALAAMLVVILTIFSVQNATNIQVRFLGWEAQMSQTVVMFSALLSGMIFGVAFHSWLRWRSLRIQSK